jgi:hypothetical protein
MAPQSGVGRDRVTDDVGTSGQTLINGTTVVVESVPFTFLS